MILERLRARSFTLLKALLARLSRPKALGVANLPEDRAFCYVLPIRSLSDLLMLEVATDAVGAPSPRDALDCQGIEEPRRFFFLHRPAGRFGRRNVMRGYSTRMIRLQRAAAAGARLDLVPVSVFWSRAPDRERAMIRVLLSENWTVTSRFRRILVFLFNRRDITVQFGTPLNVGEAIGAVDSENRATRRIARLLRVHFKQHRVALLGPDLSHRRTLVSQIVNSRDVREAIAAHAHRNAGSADGGRRLARRYAGTIASDMSYAMIRILDRVLTWFWNRIYDGVDLEGLARVKRLAEVRTLVYVPSHRSHIDYLLLSYVLYHEGLMIPHVAAGENLNLPVVGAVLRRGGAFFMKRSFRGQPLYTAVFAEYFYQMFRRGHSVEYFIEGGRSRTGRLLPARTGLLNMTLANHRRGLPKPVAFIPVYVGYEKLIEANSYHEELSGAAKRTESVGGLLSSLRLFRQSYGRVHVAFGEPLELSDYIDEHGDGATAERLGSELLIRINAAALVNPVNLVALVMLCTPRLAIDVLLLEEQVECYRRLLARERGSDDLLGESGDTVIRRVEALGIVSREVDELGDVITVSPFTAVLLTWYRNNVMHLLALPSLIACLVVNRRLRIDADALVRMVGMVYPYLATELSFEAKPSPAAAVRRWLAHLTDENLLVRFENGEHGAPPAYSSAYHRLTLLSDVVMQTLERFFIVIALLHRRGSGTTDRASLETRCRDVAARISRLYGINAPEFFDDRLFHHFVNGLIEHGVVAENDDRRLTFGALIDDVMRAAQRVIRSEFRTAVLRARQ